LTAPSDAVTIRNCTFNANTAPNGGNAGIGSVFSNGGGNSGTIFFQNSTLYGNSALNGGAIAATSGAPTFNLESTILFGNQAGGTNKADFSAGNDIAKNCIISDKAGGASFTDLGGNQYGAAADPLLTSLSDNGGPTLTMLPGPFSPAREHGSNPASVPFDQRGTGFPRTLG